MKSLKQIFLEAIPISVYREEIFKKIGKEYKTRYQSWFGKEWRIFLPIPDSEKELSPLELKVNKALSYNRYAIFDWEAGLAKSLDSDKKQRIGKLFQSLIDTYEGDVVKSNEFKGLLKSFNERSKGKGFAKKGKKIAVISRHPYDIAGQSYDRKKFTKGKDVVSDLHQYNVDNKKTQKLKDEGYEESGWTSCKHLTAMNAHYIVSEIDDGCLVAYCVHESDYLDNKKDALANPIARYLLIPVVNEEDESDTKLYITKNQYGATVKGFYEVIEEWLEDKQGDVDFDEYCVDDDRVYTGDVSGELKLKGGLRKAKEAFNGDGWYVNINDGLFTATTTNMTTLDEIIPSRSSYSGLSNAFDVYVDYGNYESYYYSKRLHDLMFQSFSIDRLLRERFFEKVGVEDYTELGDKTKLRDAIEGIDTKSDIAVSLAEWYHEAETDKYLEAMKECAERYIAKTEHLSLDSNDAKLTFQCNLTDPILQEFINNQSSDEMLKQYMKGYEITYKKISADTYDYVEGVGVDELDDFINNNIL